MYISREDREELKALSREIFRGVSSKYQDWLNGKPELVTKTVTEEVPGEGDAPPTTKEVRVPVLYNGVKQFKMKYFTVEETLTELRAIKKQIDDIKEQYRKQQEEQKAKQEAERLAKQIQEDVGGSAAP